jgi:hypothetical protein
LEEIPNAEERAWQQHENKPRTDIGHEKARKRRLTRASNLHYLGRRVRGMASLLAVITGALSEIDMAP